MNPLMEMLRQFEGRIGNLELSTDISESQAKADSIATAVIARMFGDSNPSVVEAMRTCVNDHEVKPLIMQFFTKEVTRKFNFLHNTFGAVNTDNLPDDLKENQEAVEAVKKIGEASIDRFVSFARMHLAVFCEDIDLVESLKNEVGEAITNFEKAKEEFSQIAAKIMEAKAKLYVPKSVAQGDSPKIINLADMGAPGPKIV